MKVTEAVVLMAGMGSRLRSDERPVPKPLVPVAGRPLISYIFDAFRRAGIETVHAVVGFESEIVRGEVAPLAAPGLAIHFLENPDWRKQNGVSVLAAAGQVRAPFVLTMSDHLFDQVLLGRLLESGRPSGVHLAVDRKLATIFDPDDAMKVQTRGENIVTLGKELRVYDAIDTGVFVCAEPLFEHLEGARAQGGGDCSLADGVRSLAAAGLARAVDIGDAWWQDVDTPEMLVEAERQLRAQAAGAV